VFANGLLVSGLACGAAQARSNFAPAGSYLNIGDYDKFMASGGFEHHPLMTGRVLAHPENPIPTPRPVNVKPPETLMAPPQYTVIPATAKFPAAAQSVGEIQAQTAAITAGVTMGAASVRHSRETRGDHQARSPAYLRHSEPRRNVDRPPISYGAKPPPTLARKFLFRAGLKFVPVLGVGSLGYEAWNWLSEFE